MSTRILTLLLLSVAVSAVRLHRLEPRDPQDGRKTRRRLQQEVGSAPSESHRVNSLPLADPLPFDLFAGHVKASQDGDKKFFYWLVAPEDPVAKASPNTPLLIWLNGGPGCSSNDGFFIENGPLHFEQQPDNSWKLVPNLFSWHLAPAWVLYVDQPVGTGLSITHTGNFTTTDEQVNADFHYFLEEFLLLYGDSFLQKDRPVSKNPIFFSGESHAGHYIPNMMDHILRNSDGARVKMTLGGAAIGNGWIDPFNQYAAADIAHGMGLINLSQKAKLDEQEKVCQRLLSEGNLNNVACSALLDSIVDQSNGGVAPTLVSMYDVTKMERRGAKRKVPKGYDLVEYYLAGDTAPPVGSFPSDHTTVLTAIHATETMEVNQKYRECADAPYEAMSYQDGLGVVPQITRLLENDVRLLFYNGMNDLVCNHIGTEKALLKLPWSKANAWALAPRFVWTLDGTTSPAAYVHEFQNLSFLKIPRAGHMVPQDQPEVALRMMQTFLHGKSFDQFQQQLEVALQTEAAC